MFFANDACAHSFYCLISRTQVQLINKNSFITPSRLGLIACLAVLLTRFPAWISASFGVISFEQFVYHFQSSTTGVPWRLIRTGLRELLLKPLGAYVLMYVLAKFILPATRSLKKYLAYCLVGTFLMLAAVGIAQSWQILSLGQILNIDKSGNLPKDFDGMAAMYQAPAIYPKAGVKPHNLIWIYVESLEDFRVSREKNPVLYSIKTEVINFHNLPGTGWTIGGIVSSQCGIPLMPFGLFSGNGFGDAPSFLRNATCLGDVLKKNKYQTTFIGGADTKFAGKESFLKNHGFEKIIGKKEIESNSDIRNPKNWWGYADNDILNLTFDEIQRLKNSNQPFYLSALTLDTHGPIGYLSDYCRSKSYTENIDDIFNCEIDQMEEFVKKIKNLGIMENTVLVITGDHPFMAPKKIGLTSVLEKNTPQSRKIFVAIVRPDGKRLAVSAMNHFDLFPTVLSAMGFGVERHHAGLGRDLYSANSMSAETEEINLSAMLRQPSKFYRALWE